jgi:chitodextrinase
MDYIRYNPTTQQIDVSLILSVPDDGPVTENADYLPAPDGWQWTDTQLPQVQTAIATYNDSQEAD